MIELATIFIPVVIICKNVSTDSCELVRYGGYFLSKEGCQEKIDEMYSVYFKPEYEGKIYSQSWCVDVEIEKVDKKYLPKRT